MEIIRELNEKSGHTVILITHETYTANYAERVFRDNKSLTVFKMDSVFALGEANVRDHHFSLSRGMIMR